MIQNPLQMGPKDPREVMPITLDASLMLASGEALTAITGTAITTQIGTDSTPSLVLTGAIVNAAPVGLPNGTTAAAGTLVQAVASAGTYGSSYNLAFVVQTTNPDKTLVLKATLLMSPM